MRFLTIAILVLLADTGCAAEKGIMFGFSRSEIAQCTARQGHVEHPSMSDECVYPARDGGKTCTDNKECEGSCDVPMDTPPDTKTTGKCATIVNGRGACINNLSDGVASGIICS